MELDSISRMVEGQDPTTKLLFVKQYEKHSGVPFVVNLLLGFGIGSYIQGDTTGGTVGLLGELVSVGAMTYGYLELARSAMSSDSVSYDPYTDTYHYSSPNVKISGALIAGAVGWIGFRIYEVVRPFLYSSGYNSQLSRALGTSFTAGITPEFNNNSVGMKLSAKISY